MNWKMLWVVLVVTACLATVYLIDSVKKSAAVGKTDHTAIPKGEGSSQMSTDAVGRHSLDGQRCDDVKDILSAIESNRPTYLSAMAVEPNEGADHCLVEAPVQTEDPAEAAAEAAVTQRESDRLRELESEQVDLEEYVARERQRIDAYYTEQPAKLESWAEKNLRELDYVEKTAKARYEQQVKNTESWTVRRTDTDGYVSSRGYVGSYGDTYGSGTITEREDSAEKTMTRVVGDPAGEYNRTLFRIKRARETVNRESSRISDNLQRWKAQRLRDLAAEEDRRRRTIDWHRGRIQRETQRLLSGNPNLSVDAIGAMPDGSYYAFVNGEIIHERNVVNGYRVHKIQADRVEFERDGKMPVQTMN